MSTGNVDEHGEILGAAGWTQTRSGRWHHPAFPGVHNRRKLFTTLDALALTDAAPLHPTEALRIQHACDEGVIA